MLLFLDYCYELFLQRIQLLTFLLACTFFNRLVGLPEIVLVNLLPNEVLLFEVVILCSEVLEFLVEEEVLVLETGELSEVGGGGGLHWWMVVIV